jgi:hypothetical protein
MRFLMLVKADARSEAGELPTEQELAEMMQFNEELVKAGVLLAGEGLRPSSTGARVTFRDRQPVVSDGPFAETKELIAGFWIIDVQSREEAIEWARRVPFVDGQVEIRQIAEAADFGEAFTPELQEKEAQLRAQVSARR